MTNDNNMKKPILAEIFKRSSNQKMESKKKIEKELEAQVTAKIKKSQKHQRKIWENKYGKSVGQKLLNFIEKQPEPYRLPTPKYALPKPINNKESTNIHHYDEHYTMLNQLKGLKQKNDNIQNNIQKAINVIENKMVDILEKPTTTESIKAFNEMEMEITNVLNLMKPGNSGSEKLMKLEENDVDYDDDEVDISEELFKKLDRILEIPTTPKHRDKSSFLKHNHKTLENDMNKVSFNATSTSGEEKFTITAISPKKKAPKNAINVAVEKEQKIINVALIEPQNLEENLLLIDQHHQALKNKIDDNNNNSIKNTINKLEISEQFFTPQTSPINGERIDDLLKTEEENETISDSASANTSSNYSNNNNTTSVSILSNNSSEPQHKELFYENVNRIISRVESVYNQLGMFEDEMPKKSPPKVFQDLNEIVKIPSKEFLTPFMNAMKNMKENSPSSCCKKIMQKSPSYFNVLTFLDTLSDLKEEFKGADVMYTSRVVETAYGWNIPLTFYRTVQQNQIELLLEDIPNKKKSGCLKKPSSLLNVNTTQSKSKQKVSFLLKKIEKSTQVSTTQEDSPCSNFTQLKTNSFSSCSDFSSTESNKKDQQINVCIINNNSSLYDDDDEDETYLDSNSKEIIIPQMTSDLENNKKNVVELFRNNVSDNKHIEDKVKIFYDNFYKDSDSKLISGGGYYNESSIVKLKERLSLDEKLKKINSLNKFLTKEQIHLKEVTQLLEPIRNLNQFIDTKLLRAIILNRQKIRMMIHKKNLEKFSQQPKEEEKENENFLKGIYVLVYILMFAALNLEYKCL